VLAARRALPPAGVDAAPLRWHLQVLPVCASTERELERRLREPGAAPRAGEALAVLAARQRFGHGQQGRVWQSPAGGVWISAALPWPEDPAAAAAPGLALAVGLALALEPLGLPVRLKWPNDLLVEGRKIAGLLPRLRLRGDRVRWAQVGLGLNGCHAVPAGAVALAELIGRRADARPPRLSARVLQALEWAVAEAGEPERVRALALARLLLPAESIAHQGSLWRAVGLGIDGALLLEAGDGRRTALHRRF
jgi:BirA family biotin operon repressor/biotin-[acetyl-CoA-carboxylase] ligase